MSAEVAAPLALVVLEGRSELCNAWEGVEVLLVVEIGLTVSLALQQRLALVSEVRALQLEGYGRLEQALGQA